MPKNTVSCFMKKHLHKPEYITQKIPEVIQEQNFSQNKRIDSFVTIVSTGNKSNFK